MDMFIKTVNDLAIAQFFFGIILGGIIVFGMMSLQFSYFKKRCQTLVQSNSDYKEGIAERDDLVKRMIRIHRAKGGDSYE